MVSWFEKALYFTEMGRGWWSRDEYEQGPLSLERGEPGKAEGFPSVSVFQPALLCHNVYVLLRARVSKGFESTATYHLQMTSCLLFSGGLGRG